MDFSLRCNSLKCRVHLTDRAVVTTCSHIFCVQCSESLGLASPPGSSRVCPACETHLSNPDDAVVTQLNPTEDYKTSVLSGLSPSIIMECAGRGLSFYSYQTTQEM
jgi:E3 ubiquitin-protein ligase CCNP1IP1